MNEKIKPVALILAAGNSGRMGKLKPFLPYNKNQTFIDKILSSFFIFGCAEVWIVLNPQGMKQAAKEEYYKNVHLVLNEHPERERFYSLQKGLQHIPENKPVFLHNADNPFIDQRTLELLWNGYRDNTVIIPEFEKKGGHPILLSPEIVNEILRESNEQNHLNDFLKRFPQQRIPVDNQKVLFNVNTKEDYQNYFNTALQ